MHPHHNKVVATSSTDSDTKTSTPPVRQAQQHLHRPLARNSPSIPVLPTMSDHSRLDWSTLVSTANKVGGSNEAEKASDSSAAAAAELRQYAQAPPQSNPKSIEALQSQLA